jgi:hypothetical protein
MSRMSESSPQPHVAHIAQTTSTDLMSIWFPSMILTSALPHGQSNIRSSRTNSEPQEAHTARPAGLSMRRSAPSSTVPLATSSKQNRIESTLTPDSFPISSRMLETCVSPAA